MTFTPHENREVNYKTDLDKLTLLHNKNYGENRKPDSYMWAYASLYPDESVLVVVDDKGEIVGSQGMIPIFLNVNGHVYLTGKSENSLMNKRLRGTGAFTSLYELAMSLCVSRGMTCIWGMTAATKVFSEKLGFSVYLSQLSATRILNLDRFLGSINKRKWGVLKRWIISLGSMYYYYSSRLNDPHQFNSERYQLTQRLLTWKSFDDLYTRLRNKYPGLIHIQQDKEYFKWRVAENPTLVYETYYLYNKEGSELKAYCYLTTDEGEVRIVDFTFADPKDGESLLSVILSQLKGRDVMSVSLTENAKNKLGSEVLALFCRCGFFLKDRAEAYVIKNISLGEDLSIENWYFNGLWSEGIKRQ